MKKIVFMLAIALLMQGCFTRTGRSAMAGASMGGMFGSAIGGLLGGHRGHELGTVVGVIAGAAVGASTARAAEQKRYDAEQKRYDDYVSNYNSSSRYGTSSKRTAPSKSRKTTIPVEPTTRRDAQPSSNYPGGYTGGQVPVNYQGGQIPGGNQGVPQSDGYIDEQGNYSGSNTSSPLVLRNLRFIDDGGNQTINRSEDSKIIFELANPTSNNLYDVVPYVYEVSGNSHIAISPSTRIEVVKAGDVVRYTCTLRADKKIGNGTLQIRIAVAYGDSDFVTLRDFTLPTAK